MSNNKSTDKPDTPEYTRMEAIREIEGYVKRLKADGVDINIQWNDIGWAGTLPVITLNNFTFSLKTLADALAFTCGLSVGYHIKCNDVKARNDQPPERNTTMRCLVLPFVLFIGTILAGEPPAKDQQPNFAAVNAGTLYWIDSTMKFAGDIDLAAACLRKDVRLYTAEYAEEWSKKIEAEFKTYSTRPEFTGYRLQVSPQHSVERHETGLKFMGKWDESAITVFEKAFGLKRIADKPVEKAKPAKVPDHAPKVEQPPAKKKEGTEE